MARSLSNLVDNLSEGIHKIAYKDCDCFLKYIASRIICENINVCLAIKNIQRLIKN